MLREGNTMKIGVIGCGQIADAHLQQIRRIADAKTVAVCDLNRHLAEQAALRFQVEKYYTDVELMIRETKPDVIHITTPPASHYPLAKMILNHGIHIYMEKPFTVDYKEAEEIVDLARENGCEICAGHSHAFDPSYLKLVEAYEAGKFGELVHLNAGMGYGLSGPFGKVMMTDPTHWVHKLPGGIPQNNMSHPVSLILGVMKESNIRVHAHGYKWREQRYHDARDAFWDEIRVSLYGASSSANIVFSAKIKPLELYLDIFGSKSIGRLNWYARMLTFDGGASFPGPFEKVQWSRSAFKSAKSAYKTNLRNLFKSNLHYFDGMKNLIESFYNAIRQGGEMPLPMSEALRATKIIDDIFTQLNLTVKENG
jgi:predicted dehydrogenase